MNENSKKLLESISTELLDWLNAKISKVRENIMEKIDSIDSQVNKVESAYKKLA